MNIEKSCGAVIYTEINGEIKYLIIQSKEGFYGFPKGHIETGEKEEQTALREIEEETGVRVILSSDFRAVDVHAIPQKVDTIKEVVYFVGYYSDQMPEYQKEELAGIRLCGYMEAMDLFQFDSTKRILTEAKTYIESKR